MNTNQLLHDAVNKLIEARHIAIEKLTQEQVADAVEQAVKSGDFIRMLRVDNDSQTVVYYPLARASELENELGHLTRWLAVNHPDVLAHYRQLCKSNEPTIHTTTAIRP